MGVNGTGPQGTMQGGAGNTGSMQYRQTKGSGSGMTTTQTPATTTIK